MQKILSLDGFRMRFVFYRTDLTLFFFVNVLDGLFDKAFENRGLM